MTSMTQAQDYFEDLLCRSGLLPDVGACINPCREIVLPVVYGVPVDPEFQRAATSMVTGTVTAVFNDPTLWKKFELEKDYPEAAESVEVRGIDAKLFEPHSEFERNMLNWLDESVVGVIPGVVVSRFSEETRETVHNLMSAPVAWDPHSGLEDPRS